VLAVVLAAVLAGIAGAAMAGTEVLKRREPRPYEDEADQTARY
jgi:hypothetical protein